MRPELRKGSLALLVVCSLLAGAAFTITGTEDFMKRLPLYERFQCANCHSVPSPTTGNAPLNDFGTAFHSNGDVWNQTLANMDSDGDGYSNGMELGDDDGDGSTSVATERSNPGDPNETPSSVDPKTWGVIKRLFDD